MREEDNWELVQTHPCFMARRFPKNELASLIQLQSVWQTKGNYRFPAKRFYPNHKTWLERAEKELEQGIQKVALGLFVKGVKQNQVRYRPVAAVILGHSPMDPNDIELKSLLVDTKLAKQALSETSITNAAKNAKGALLRYSEQYCALRGFQELEIEVPADEVQQVSFMVEAEFSIRSLYAKPRLDSRFYRLSRPISPIYGGDPFDEPGIAKWFIRSNLTAQIPKVSNELAQINLNDGKTKTKRLHSYQFSVLPSSLLTEKEYLESSILTGDSQDTMNDDAADTVEQTKREHLSVETQVTVIPGGEDDRNWTSITAPEFGQLKFALSTTRTSESLQRLLTSGWKVIGKDLLPLFIGKLSSWSLNYIGPDDQGGLLIDLEESYAESLTNDMEWTYFASNGFGREVMLETIDETLEVYDIKSLALFVSRGESPEHKFGGAKIWGYATISNVLSTDYKGVEKEWKNKRTLMTPSEIQSTVLGFRGSIYPDIRSEHDKDFHGLELIKTRLLDTAIPLEDFVTQEWCSPAVKNQLVNYEEECVRSTDDNDATKIESELRHTRLLFDDMEEPLHDHKNRNLFRIDYESRTFYIDWETSNRFAEKSKSLLIKQANPDSDMLCDVFISYRKNDCQTLAHLLHEKLQQWSQAHPQNPKIFYDKNREIGIQIGDQMREKIKRHAEACKVFLMLVGPDWAGVNDPLKKTAKSRINKKDDYIRFEAEIALNRFEKDSSFKLFLVMIDDAKMPARDEMKPLSKLLKLANSVIKNCKLREDDFENDFKELLWAIENGVKK